VGCGWRLQRWWGGPLDNPRCSWPGGLAVRSL